MRSCIYPGSFDPFTEGHMDVLRHAADLFDYVYVGVLNNIAKKPMFSAEHRVNMIREALAVEGFTNVHVESFDGLLVEYARSLGVRFIIRGLRATTDFEYEFQIGALNKHLAPEIQTVYIMASPEHSFLSSSAVREILTWGGKTDGLLPESIANSIKKGDSTHE